MPLESKTVQELRREEKMKTLGSSLMAVSLLIMIASIVAVIALACGLLAPIWLAAACPGAFITGLAGKIFCEVA